MDDLAYKEYLEKQLSRIFVKKKKPLIKEGVKKWCCFYGAEQDWVEADPANTITPGKYDFIWDFHNDYSRVRRHGKYNFFHIDGFYININGFKTANDFHEGIAMVGYDVYPYKESDFPKKVRFYYIDVHGNDINNEYYAYGSDFKDGYAVVGRVFGKPKKQKIKENYINKRGWTISEEWYDKVWSLGNGYALVLSNKGYAIVNNKGKRITKWKRKEPNIHFIGKNFFHIDDLIVCTSASLTGALNDFRVFEGTHSELKQIDNSPEYAFLKKDKTSKSYVCVRDKIGYETKHKPVWMFVHKIALCVDGYDVYLHNENNETNPEIMIGQITDIEFTDDLIINNKTGKVLFVYYGDIYDISDYYNKNVKGKKDIIVKKTIVLLTRDEFYEKNRKLLKQEDDRRKKEEAQELNNSISELVDDLEKDAGINEPKKRTKVNDLFVPKDDHLQINPIYLEGLKRIDLEGVSFADVEISGIDFRGCNLTFGENGLNPQEVWDKDLRCCNFEDIFVCPDVDFTGVDIRGARFGRDKSLDTDDRGSDTFQEAIYDSSTTFDGISFTMIYGECKNKKEGASK